MQDEKKYTKEGLIERYLERALTSDEKGLLHLLIPSVASFIDTYTNRSFKDIDDETDPAPETRLYDGQGGCELFVDDFTEITKLEFLNSLGVLYLQLPTQYYTFYPLNTTYKNSIYLRYYEFPHYKASVQVTGVFTTGDLPQEISHAATALVVIALSRAKIDSSQFTRESIEGYTYIHKGGNLGENYDEVVKPVLKTLDRWVKIQF